MAENCATTEIDKKVGNSPTKTKKKIEPVIVVSTKNNRYVKINSKKLFNTIEDVFCNRFDIYPNNNYYYEINELIGNINPIKTIFSDKKIIKPLIDVIENEIKHSEKIKKEYTEKNKKISFITLERILTPGTKILIKKNDMQIVGGRVFSVQRQNNFFYGEVLSVRYNHMVYHDNHFQLESHYVRIPRFSGEKTFSELPISLISDETYDQIYNRGLKFIQLVNNREYANYSGSMVIYSSWNIYHFKADGRIVVDVASFDKFSTDNYPSEQSETFDNVPDDWVFTLPHFIKGYSLVLKMWGQFDINGISQIQFNKDAFDLLVIEEEKKDLIQSLVETKVDFNDIIGGKGGGLLFLLYGTPGTGKTLTAEAIAEKLQRPLYYVSVGELGTTPEDLEERLRKILELATLWDAVLLLDEADIFLEARSENDIERNAMVSIFLKLLEYYSGIMFLTTNRASSIDTAFYSRISLSIKYDELNSNIRKTIWKNILEKQKIELKSSDLNILSTHDLNGRQIKNIVRMSIAIAKHKNIATPNLKIIDNVIKHVVAFDPRGI